MTNNTGTTLKNEIDYLIDGLLADWYSWRREYKLAKGYSGQDATCRDYRTPGHWDWKNGAADARADELVMKAVDAAIERIPNTPERWNTAIQFEAMNLHSGAAVWTSPMLPRNKAERDVLIMEARNMLARELRKDGIIG